MLSAYPQNPKPLQTWLFFTAFTLLMAITFHALNFHHRHPAFLGGDNSVIVNHGEDKKWVAILAGFFVWVFVKDFARELFSYFGGFLKKPANIYVALFFLKPRHQLFDFLRRGLLAPKAA